jgi:hypothetical protein
MVERQRQKARRKRAERIMAMAPHTHVRCPMPVYGACCMFIALIYNGRLHCDCDSRLLVLEFVLFFLFVFVLQAGLGCLFWIFDFGF